MNRQLQVLKKEGKIWSCTVRDLIALRTLNGAVSFGFWDFCYFL